MKSPQIKYRQQYRLFRVLGLALIFVCQAVAALALTGACVDCHTMHNSQGGSVMTFDGSATAGNMLLRGTSCGGCHADSTTLSVPKVNISTSSDVLAGGSFAWVLGAASPATPETPARETTGHDVADLGLAFDGLPPGFNSSTSGDIGTFSASTPLTCSGTYGCHGDHGENNKFNAMEGAHHTNAGNNGSTVLSGSTVGSSYRFLKGVKGIELNSSDGWAETTSDHNVYYGSVGDGDSSTISALCAQCHGDFHTRTEIGGTSSPWLRHPTDIDMSTLGGEFTYYGDTIEPVNSSAYSLEAPVAATVLASMTSASVLGNYDKQILTCVSCHRAHGSPYYKILRWDYPNSVAGCGICHTSKR
ncbi:doubled CXXCH domain-containing protein [Malonomonas rubra DSM 5091]|uniref:Doubled CXXCH domain-containing protein n=1 Tax=Malonomonas rubra DSM 5091 TaxID=1122189 RepID=A0A1M6BZU1_MALRU|nr:cytochrome c3 family protein [Malonomonas rubra]SHI53948.1 doubled CXXCH domain-containing protein [Malonomonas rubra DSM 5091]